MNIIAMQKEIINLRDILQDLTMEAMYREETSGEG